jgi:hypothetical protein
MEVVVSQQVFKEKKCIFLYLYIRYVHCTWQGFWGWNPKYKGVGDVKGIQWLARMIIMYVVS